MYKQTALFNEVYIYIFKRPSKGKKPTRVMLLGSSSSLLANRGGGRVVDIVLFLRFEKIE